MKILVGLLLLLFTLDSPAQVLRNIKNKVLNKGKNEVSEAKYTAKQKAREAVKNELNDFKADFDSTDLDYALLLSDNAGLYGGKGRGEFGAKFLRLTSIARSFYQDADLTDEENARLNLQLGQSGYAMGKFIFAEKRLKTAQSYFEKAFLTKDLGYQKCISGQGLLFTTMGRYRQAEKFIVSALELREKDFGENDMGVAASINNYAVLHYNLGQYNDAEKKFNRALSIIEWNKLQSSIPYAIVLNNQAMLNQSIGRYEVAEKNLNKALAIERTSATSKSKNFLKFFSNLALLYQQMGKYDQAEEIYNELEKRLEKDKPEFANMLNNVAILLLVMNKHERIEELLKQSAEIYKSTLGDNSPAYAKVISDLGIFYRYKNRYTDAEPLLLLALKIRENTLGSDHPLFVQSQEDLAILYWKKKDYPVAGELYQLVMEKSLDFINRYFPPMSEAEKTKYWDLLAPRFQRFYNFALEAESTENNLVQKIFEYRVATKGILLNSIRKVSESIFSSGDKQLISLYTSWIDQKEQLANLYIYSKEELKEQSINIDSLESAANFLEKRLSESSESFAHFYFTNRVNLAQVQSVLKSDEALIEVIRLSDYNEIMTDSCRYLAMVITKNEPPAIIMMDNGFDMENKVFKSYRRSMAGKISDERSYDYFWAKIDAALVSKKTIYLSPDGIYNQVNINTLKKNGGDFMIKKYDIVLVGNPKDLILQKQDAQGTIRQAALIGYPDYGATTIPPLPGTKTEVDGINKLLQKAGYHVAEWIQKDATESNLKSVKQMTVLHIATHGYFLQDVNRTPWPIGVHSDFARDNVLLRSGLLLTGASETDKNTTGLDNSSNGIITSYEAMNLDLKGTNLVVLSACETALGDVKAGEGVYGLQRAFLEAGARALIMSLWKVDDEATQQLMNYFYSNWIKSGNMRQAFKEAQLELMTRYKEPFYWGVFVMMQD